MNEANGQKSIPELLQDRSLIQRAMREAVQDAIRVHKLLGHPIVVWRDGKIVTVPPEDIQLNEEKNGPPKLPDDAIP